MVSRSPPPWICPLIAARGPCVPVPTQRKSLLQTLEGNDQWLTYFATQIELGTACGKLFRCSTMAILDAGDSDILSDQQQ